MFTANSMNCLAEAIGLAAARQRHHAGHPHRPARPVRAGRPADRRHHPAATTSRTTSRCCPARSPAGTRSRTRWRWTWPWAARPTRSCTCSPRPRGPGRTSASRRSTSCPGGCPACARSRRAATTTSRTCTGPAASRPSSASWTGPACSTRVCTPCTAGHAARLPRRVGPRLAVGQRRGGGAVPRGARGSPHHRAVLADGPVGGAGHRPGDGLHPGRGSTPTAPTAAWPSSTATWPPTARS